MSKKIWLDVRQVVYSEIEKERGGILHVERMGNEKTVRI